MLHKEITEDIIGAAMAVLNELKPGLDEKLDQFFEKLPFVVAAVGRPPHFPAN